MTTATDEISSTSSPVKAFTAKHTPRPWIVEFRPSNRVGPNSKPIINGAQIVSARGLHVASLSNKADKPLDQKQADGYMIAAAPELYAMLSDILEFLQRSGYDTKLVKSVMAQARGETA